MRGESARSKTKAVSMRYHFKDNLLGSKDRFKNSVELSELFQQPFAIRRDETNRGPRPPTAKKMTVGNSKGSCPVMDEME